MVKGYSRLPNSEKTVMAKAKSVKVSFKNTYECAKMMKGKTIEQVRAYFNQVLAHKRCIPFMRFNGAVGRTS